MVWEINGFNQSAFHVEVALFTHGSRLEVAAEIFEKFSLQFILSS
jgi:hypothetical protein